MTKNTLVRFTALGILVTSSVAIATTQTSVSYVCNAGSKATAQYDTTTAKGGAIVTFGGNTLAFDSASSGSGARYTTAVGPYAIAPLEWWTKGRDATLSELASHSRTSRLIATCHQAR